MNIVLVSLLVMGIVGVIAGLLLSVVAKKFYVKEDPRIERIESLLAGANCGACGYSGCHDFAVNSVAAGSLDGMHCPITSASAMADIAKELGVAAVEGGNPMVAVVKCGGECGLRSRVAGYDGPKVCAIAVQAGGSGKSCDYGCLGMGDCERACGFNAIKIDGATQLPVVDQDRCTACGMCVKACPKSLIELRKRGPRNLRIYVACSNRDRGAVARKECKVACIGCGKCQKVCPHGAITVADNLAYIDANLCKLCKKCVAECPTGAIRAVNFPMIKIEVWRSKQSIG